jgi:hypothetical protein
MPSNRAVRRANGSDAVAASRSVKIRWPQVAKTQRKRRAETRIRTACPWAGKSINER